MEEISSSAQERGLTPEIGAGAVVAGVPGRGQQGLKGKNRPGGKLMRTRAKLGEMTMRVELQAELLEKGGYGDELRKLLRRLDG